VRPVRVTVQKQFRINLTALVLNNVTLIHKIPTTVVMEEFGSAMKYCYVCYDVIEKEKFGKLI
jgi:hypothetical protein